MEFRGGQTNFGMRRSTKKLMLCFLPSAIVISLLVLFLSWSSYKHFYMYMNLRDSKNWGEAQGEVLKYDADVSSFINRHGSEVNVRRSNIIYKYYIDSIKYYGDVFSYGSSPFRASRSYETKFFEVGSQVKIFYLKSNPEISALEMASSKSNLFYGSVFLLLALIVFVGPLLILKVSIYGI